MSDGPKDPSSESSAHCRPPTPTRGRRLRDKAQAWIGSVVAERYRLDDVVAIGGLGAVYRAEHLALRRKVAVKLLFPDAEAFPLLATRMEREGLVGAHLVHPNIAAALDFGVLEDGGRYLVSEFVPGRTLREVMRNGPLPLGRCLSLALQLAEAIQTCHQRRVIHRDLKPGNVMVDEGAGDIVKLIDFGLAQVPVHEVTHDEGLDDEDAAPTQQNLTVHGLVFGTIAYLAPETALGMSAVDERSDLYAFGVILYEMLAGKHPFDATDPAELFLHHRVVTPAEIAQRNPDVRVPAAVEAVVQRLMAKRPEDRYASATEAIAALRASVSSPQPSTAQSGSIRPMILTGVPLSSSSTSTPLVGITTDEAPETFPRAARPNRRTMALAAGALLACAVVTASFLQRPSAAMDQPAGRTDTILAQSAPPPYEASAATIDPDRAVKEALAQGEARRRFRDGADKGRWPEAILALRELVVRDPAALATADDRRRAVKVASRAALAEHAHAEELFDALAESAGQHGLDVLYDIVETQGGARAADLAWARLDRGDVLGRASPALAIAVRLRRASCQNKSALFEQAASAGDRRTAILLERLRSNKCDSRRGECCFHGNGTLERAIREIDGRR